MEPYAPQKKETSPWVYIGCGCAGLVILGMAAFAGLTFFAYRKGKEIEKTWSDPKAREEKAREVLVYDKLPEGYYPVGAMSIPFVMDMAIIGDNPPPAGTKPDDHEGFKERGFMYFKMRKMMMGKGDKDLQDYMQGKGSEPDWLKGNAEVDTGEVLGRGEVEAAGQKILYSATRGELHHKGEHHQGITTMMMVDCPQDNRIRFGLWFGPDPKPEEPADKVDLTGTNADPEAIKAFASHFKFCAAG